jgi:DNA-directed RNA polymerase specialized sigma24 family protein
MTFPAPNTSASLLERLRDQRDAQAWQKLVAVYTPLMRAWLRPVGLQAFDLDDLTQGVLQVVVRKLPQFEHSGRPGAFRAWLRGITVNALREFWRARPPGQQPPAADALLEQLQDPASDFGCWWDQEHDCHVVNGLLRLVEGDFAPTTWRAFRRTMLDDLPAETVAAELQMSVNAVLIAKSRVLARLRQEARGLVD